MPRIGFLFFCAISFLFFCFKCTEHSDEGLCDKTHKTEWPSLEQQLQPVKDKLKKQTAGYILENAGEALGARAWLCDYAQKNLDIQYFIFSADNVGLISCDYLIHAADRGVKIRMLVDDILADATPGQLGTLDKHENIEIKIFNPAVNLGKHFITKLKKMSISLNGVQQRLHQKTVIADKMLVIMGGRNVADEYYGYHHEYNFVDRDVLMMGAVMDSVNANFDQFWNSPLSIGVSDLLLVQAGEKEVKRKYQKLHRYACDPDYYWPQIKEEMKRAPEVFRKVMTDGSLVWMDSVRYVADKPLRENQKLERRKNITTESLIDLIKNAKERIDIQSPYLISSDDLGAKLLKEAVARGVKIRILTNSLASTDNTLTFSAYQRDRAEFLKAGVRIYEFRPDAAIRMKNLGLPLIIKGKKVPKFGMHAKSMIVDGYISVVGTFNLDPRSVYYNCECQAIMYSSGLAAQMQKDFDEMFKAENAWETTSEWNPDKEAPAYSQVKAFTRRVVPKHIL